MAEFKHKNQYENEMEIGIKQFLSGPFIEACHEKVLDTKIEYYYSAEPTPFSEMKKKEFTHIKVGDVWAKENFACAWFHITAKLPKDLNRNNLYLRFSDDGEGLLVDKDGHAIKGFSDGSIWGWRDFHTIKNHYPIDDFVDKDGNFDAYIDGASNSLLGTYSSGKLLACAIDRRNEKLLDIYYDTDLLYYLGETLPLNSEDRNHLMYELQKVCNLVRYKDPDFYEKGKAILNSLFESKFGKDYSHVNPIGIGHAHLDLAWLWPLRESYRKAKRTFTNQIYLFKKYPDYKFIVSQPQQLEWMKEQDPKLYEELKYYEKTGQLEIIGGGWVENDTNVPSEESLVRQELYGQMFYKEEFGHYVDVRWLPDTFGYSAAIPQILKQTHQDYFMTIKISWSNRTIFPYNTFNWAGIDGTTVKVHMPPEGNYNSVASPCGARVAVEAIKETDPQDRYLNVFGIGDGGGGPSELIVERNLRLPKIKTMPRMKLGKASDFFHGLDSLELPTYQGEMYLEKHRATYTSQSNNKNYNRQFENMMGTYEKILSGLGLQGDRELINKTWKEALLYQFHDILPGSSIKRVYDETDAAYPVLLNRIETLVNDLGYTFKAGNDLKLVNSENKDVYKLIKADNGYSLYKGSDSVINPIKMIQPMIANEKEYNNGNFNVVIGDDGFIKEITLTNNKEAVSMRNLNKLRVFIDIGDAWDFVDDYRDQPKVYMTLEKEEINRYENNELLEIKQHYAFKESKLVQTILIGKGSKIIDIHHSVDWKNAGYMVRAEFENLGFYSNEVNSDIQFGYLSRPTTDDTEHNAAQFEMCAQKWFDLSNDKQGISIINNAKSGFMAKNGIISLALFRSTNYPCENAEIKHIEYSYAIYPHHGGFNPVDVDKVADIYNFAPVFGEKSIALPTVDNDNIQITAFKPAYDGNGFILRMFERAGKPCTTTLKLNGYKLVAETNLLEEEIGSCTNELSFSPFQIRTFRLQK